MPSGLPSRPGSSSKDPQPLDRYTQFAPIRRRFNFRRRGRVRYIERYHRRKLGRHIVGRDLYSFNPIFALGTKSKYRYLSPINRHANGLSHIGTDKAFEFQFDFHWKYDGTVKGNLQRGSFPFTPYAPVFQEGPATA